MKIKKRDFANPLATINIWFIPTLFYLSQKCLGTIIHSREWMYPLGISIALLIWFVFNFKIVTNKNK